MNDQVRAVCSLTLADKAEKFIKKIRFCAWDGHRVCSPAAPVAVTPFHRPARTYRWTQDPRQNAFIFHARYHCLNTTRRKDKEFRLNPATSFITPNLSAGQFSILIGLNISKSQVYSVNTLALICYRFHNNSKE